MRRRALSLVLLPLWLACSAGRAPEPEAHAIVPPGAHSGSDAPSSIQKWAAAMQPKPVVDFFAGLFHRVGVRVSDTGEAFTVVHSGDRILFSDELDEAAVDFTVSIDSAQVDRMLGYMKAGALSERARFRIMAVIATPATRALLARPVIRSERLRELLYWIGNAEERTQVVLIPPPGESEVGHTIERRGAVTTVTAGLHGTAERVYRLSVDDAVEFQRRMIAARSADSLWTWIQFARWYGEMRARVAVPSDAGVAVPGETDRG
jgi:hypothetical protein